MSPPKILIADNDALFAAGCAEFFENSGYRVLMAFNPADAGRALEEDGVHLAILDLRMVDDHDEKDLSGLALARRSDPLIPKIILTAYQRWEDVRDALGLVGVERPPAVSFVAKQEGLDVLLSHARRALDTLASRNWRLHIEWRARELVSLLGLIDPGLAPEQLAARAEELEDLFRLLFRKQTQVRFERLLWAAGGRAALSCFAFEEGRQPETFLVVCGQKAAVTEEARLYEEFAPKAAGAAATVLEESGARTHYAANVYTLAGAHLENLRPLEALYHAGPEKSFNLALQSLFGQTLAGWSQNRFVVGSKRPLRRVLLERLGLPPKQPWRAITGERLRELSEHLPAVGLAVSRSAGRLSFGFGGAPHSYADPSRPLAELADAGWDTLLVHTPGELSGESVLVDGGERAWVTNFMRAGLAPPLWAFAEIEAVVRFDWMGVARVEWLHELERQLVFGDFLKLQPTEVEPPLRKPLRAIRTIRLLARQACGNEPRPYHLAVLLQIGKRLAATPAGPHRLPAELSRPAHLLLAAAMLYDRLAERWARGQTGAGDAAPGIRLDKSKGEVWVDGRRLNLRGHSYSLLCNFYDHPNQLRTRRELIEEVFAERYDERDFSQVSRLNTAIHRLRQQLESDPENPHYLLTEPRVGYRLILTRDDKDFSS